MAITATNRLDQSDDAAGASFVTSSVAFTDGKLYLATASLRGGTTPSVSAITGGGITWVSEEANTTGGPPSIITYRGLVASGASSGALTITYSGTPTSAKISVDEFDGVDTSGTNGSGAIVQSVPANGNGTAGSVTLASFGDAVNNVAYGAFEHNATETTTVDASGGWAALVNNATAVTPAQSLMTEYKTGEDTTVTATWTTSIAWIGNAFEIKASVEEPPETPNGVWFVA